MTLSLYCYEPGCVIVTVLVSLEPVTVNTAVLPVVPGFWAVVTRIVPSGPLPDEPPTMLENPALDTAVQEHPTGVSTEIPVFPPTAGTLYADLTVSGQVGCGGGGGGSGGGGGGTTTGGGGGSGGGGTTTTTGGGGGGGAVSW